MPERNKSRGRAWAGSCAAAHRLAGSALRPTADPGAPSASATAGHPAARDCRWRGWGQESGRAAPAHGRSVQAPSRPRARRKEGRLLARVDSKPLQSPPCQLGGDERGSKGQKYISLMHQAAHKYGFSVVYPTPCTDVPCVHCVQFNTWGSLRE
eukprot:5925952-Prymnesium_polylepis.1